MEVNNYNFKKSLMIMGKELFYFEVLPTVSSGYFEHIEYVNVLYLVCLSVT